MRNSYKQFYLQKLSNILRGQKWRIKAWQITRKKRTKVHELWLDVSICSGRASYTQQTLQVIWCLVSCVIFGSLSAHHVVELWVSFIFWTLPLMSPWELYETKHETWSLWTPSPHHELLCRSFDPAERQVITCDLFERVWWSIQM